MTQVRRTVRCALVPGSASGLWAGGVRGWLPRIVAGGLVTLPVAAGGIELSNVGGTVPGFVFNGEAANDQSGSSVAGAGDVNRDGWADIIIGAGEADPPAGISAGRAYVVFCRSGLGNVNLSNVSAGSGPGFVINGAATLDRLGQRVACAGDFNGDFMADVIVGAPFADGPAGADAGKVYLVWGKTSNSPVFVSSLEASGLGLTIHGAAAGGYAGSAVSSAGDVNGDGLDDLLIGAKKVNSLAGAAYVVFAGKIKSPPLYLSAIAAGTGGYVINGESGGGQAGTSVASAGDVNGDGLCDVLVGAPRMTVGANANAGRAYIVFGRTTSTAVALSAVAAGTGGFALSGQDANGYAGQCVAAAGDVNGDGLADVLVGAPKSSPTSGAAAGRSYVVFGRMGSSGINLSEIETGAAGGWVMLGEAANDNVGTSVSAAGDVDGNGLADVLAAAPYHDRAGASNAGRAYVVHGRTASDPILLSGIPANPPDYVVDGAAAADLAGFAATNAGDVNGDGIHDFVVGASQHDPVVGGATLSNAGRTYIVLSTEAPLASATYRGVAPNPAVLYYGIGTQGNGARTSAGCESRAWLNFTGGSPASVAVTLHRNDAGIANFAPADLADVHWRIETMRTGWSTVRIVLRYTEPEIAGLFGRENSLYAYVAPTEAGPFALPPAQMRDYTHNEITVDVRTLPMVFVLSAVPPTPAANGDANGDGSIDVADVTTINNLLLGIIPPPLPGDGDVNNNGNVDGTDVVLLVGHLVDGTPLP